MTPADAQSRDPSAAQLQRRFLALILWAVVPVVLALCVLIWRGYVTAQDEVLDRHAEAQHRLGAELGELAGDVRTHVSILRAFTEGRLARSGATETYLGPVEWLSPLPGLHKPLGLVMADPALLVPADRQEMAAVLPLFDISQAMHAAAPGLKWSYFFSGTKRFVAIYPRVPAAEMLAGGDPSGVFRSFFDYDLFTFGEPQNNADHSAYWTPVYLDAGGAGLMVTHGTPVWANGRFRGIVAADLLISEVAKRIAAAPGSQGDVAVLDQKGNVIAATGLPLVAQAAAPPADTVLNGVRLDELGPGFRHFAGRWVARRGIAGTPWHLVVTVPDAVTQAAVVQRVLPLFLLLGCVLAGVVLLVLLVRRQFVLPAVTLARYAALAPAEAAVAPDLPRPWQALTDRIQGAARAELANIRQMRAMIDGIPLRAVYVDADFVYRDANREFLDFVGLEREQLIGRSVAEVLGPKVAAEYAALEPQILRGEVARFEGWIEFASKGRRFLQVSVLPFLREGETRAGFLTFTRDLTELKEAETEAERSHFALREREERYRAVVLAALDAIVVMDEDGRVLEFNPAAEQTFGYTAAEAIGQPVADLIVPPTMREAHRRGMARFIETGVPHVIGRRVEVEGMRRDGSTFPVELTVTEVPTGGPRIFTSHLRDLTEARRLAREMEDSRNRLHQVEKLSAMGSLLAGVAHELNNPLAVVVAQSTLLADKAPDAATNQRAEKIRAAADRCGRIVKSFLAMARQKPPQRERVQVEAVLQGALEVVGYGLRSAGVEVDLALPEGLPAIEGDRDLLGQVFSNILINAQQAMTGAPAPRRIRLSASAAGGWLRLRFEDNGPGVPEALRKRIFDPYFTTKAVGVGTGIGLSISRSVIEAHGGALSLVDSALGGAGFELRLPALPDAVPAAAGASGVARGPSGHRALIVDDEADVAESLAEILGLHGVEAEVTTDAASAPERLAAGGFDLLFTDLRMPGIDGVALIRLIRERVPGFAGPFVLVTGDTVAGPAHMAATGLERVETLEKPFGTEDVAALLRRILGA